MSKYEICGPAKDCALIRTKVHANNYGGWKYQYFAGYDPMGSVDWVDCGGDAYWATPEEAKQIVKDLEAADEPVETAKRINAGYEIIRSLAIDAKHEIVIGKHPTAPATYVVWDCYKGDDYRNGGYCMTFRQALAIIAERINNRYDNLPVDA